jgi:hypothetical protein
VLGLRELNRAFLARQLLLARSRLPVLDALEQVVALQATLVVEPFERLASHDREALEREARRLLEFAEENAASHAVS